MAGIDNLSSKTFVGLSGCFTLLYISKFYPAHITEASPSLQGASFKYGCAEMYASTQTKEI